MSNCIIVGCDLHDRSMLIKWSVGRGKARRRAWRNDVGGREKMIEFLQTQAEEAKAERIVFAYEASCLGYGLYDQLRENGVECYVLAPTAMERSPKHERNKTDEKDAQKILDVVRAHVLAGAELPAIWVPDMQTRQDRQIVRRRLELADHVACLKTRITALTKVHDLRPGKDVERWTAAHRQWLQELTAEQLGYGGRTALDSLLRELQFAEGELALQQENVEVLAKDERYAEPVAELCDLTGVGLLTAMVFLTEMGRMDRFRNRRQVGAYLGLAPCAHESGEQSDHKGHITKQGPARVRKMLCQATWALLGHDAEETAVHERVMSGQATRKKTATVALMRRLAVRMWHAAGRAQDRAGCFGPPAGQDGTRQEAPDAFPGAAL